MLLVSQLKQKRARFFITLAVLALMAYFLYHLFSGDKNLGVYFANEAKIVAGEQILEALQDRKRQLENSASRLQSDNLDLELLEEEVRKKLRYLHPDEFVLPIPEAEKP